MEQDCDVDVFELIQHDRIIAVACGKPAVELHAITDPHRRFAALGWTSVHILSNILLFLIRVRYIHHSRVVKIR